MTESSGFDSSIHHDSDSGIFRASFDPDSEPVSDAVVWTIVEVTGKELGDLEPIESVVDPIVFDALVRRQRRSIQLNFEFSGYDVLVESRGNIMVQSIQSDGGAEYTCRISEEVSPSTAVVEALAAAKGVDPVEVDRLYDTIDPDALDLLVESATDGDSSGLEVSFQIAGSRVQITNDRRIIVNSLAPEN